MAARTKKVRLSDAWKAKIQASVISNRLYDHLQGKIEMTPTQIKAADILLKKMVPDLNRSEMVGDEEKPIKLVFGWMK